MKQDVVHRRSKPGRDGSRCTAARRTAGQPIWRAALRGCNRLWCCVAIAAVVGIADVPVAAQPQEHRSPRVVIGDPQLMSDHPWFPGELACSTFGRLFATQAALYRRVTGRQADTDEDRAIASWYWRNLTYYHNYSPREAYWDAHLSFDGEDNPYVVREYWTGLFAYGFSLCGNTHAQYTAEMQTLLGPCRARAVDVDGHTSFEVFLRDPAYGPSGDWAVLDHDISTIVFDDPKFPRRLLNMWNIAYVTPPPERQARSAPEREALLDNTGAPDANRGWFKSGLYFPRENTDARQSDAFGCYTTVGAVAPLSGYASVPPMVTLRRNETLRRYLRPGLGGSTYVYWGPNMRIGGIPGPCRDRTWACEPARMYRATRDTEATSFARYGNAVYTYRPNFADGSYRDAAVEESDRSVTFYFYAPYAIAATPADEKADELWATLYPGCRNGLVITTSSGDCTVQVSTDNGHRWSPPVAMRGAARVDLTDAVKGHHAYHLRLGAPAGQLDRMGLEIRTVLIANDRLIPHLKDGGTTVTYQASGRAVFAAGPNIDQAAPFVIEGGFGQDHVVMRVPAPAGQPIVAVHAAAQVASGSPPDGNVRYQIDVSSDGGASWQPIVRDWRIERLGYQSDDTWSRSFCYGSRTLTGGPKKVLVRFTNDGGIAYLRTEVHLVYATGEPAPLRVTFAWSEGEGAIARRASHLFPAAPAGRASRWAIDTGRHTVTDWVEMAPAR